MRMLIVLALAVIAFVTASSHPSTSRTSDREFEKLMQTLAEGWNDGNAVKAADCFTEDAIYTQPPDKQLYKGRAALFKFFGGNEGRKSQMKMTWHHLTFNPRTQIGTGEFTFEYGGKVHGMVIVLHSELVFSDKPLLKRLDLNNPPTAVGGIFQSLSPSPS